MAANKQIKEKDKEPSPVFYGLRTKIIEIDLDGKVIRNLETIIQREWRR